MERRRIGVTRRVVGRLQRLWNGILTKLRPFAAGLLTVLVGSFGQGASTPPDRPPELRSTAERIEALRARVRAAASDEQKSPQPTRIGQWVNWPNWPNWGNWSDWRNYWPNW
jgi:hypothetical protein